MAKKKKTHSKPKFTLPLAVVGGFVPLITKGMEDYRAGGIAGLQNTIPAITCYSPANKKFTFAQAHRGIIPIMVGFGIHKVATMVGLNRVLAQARVPFLRI